jgi:hypothetical protein
VIRGPCGAWRPSSAHDGVGVEDEASIAANWGVVIAGRVIGEHPVDLDAAEVATLLPAPTSITEPAVSAKRVSSQTDVSGLA